MTLMNKIANVMILLFMAVIYFLTFTFCFGLVEMLLKSNENPVLIILVGFVSIGLFVASVNITPEVIKLVNELWEKWEVEK